MVGSCCRDSPRNPFRCLSPNRARTPCHHPDQTRFSWKSSTIRLRLLHCPISWMPGEFLCCSRKHPSGGCWAKFHFWKRALSCTCWIQPARKKHAKQFYFFARGHNPSVEVCGNARVAESITNLNSLHAGIAVPCANRLTSHSGRFPAFCFVSDQPGLSTENMENG